MRERNRCNHRDYHNLARNGANSSDTLYYMKAMGRQARDLPAILFYSLIGDYNVFLFWTFVLKINSLIYRQ